MEYGDVQIETPRDISNYIEGMYGTELSATTISNITDEAMVTGKEWFKVCTELKNRGVKDIKKSYEEVSNRIKTRIDPSIIPTVDIVDVEGKKLIVVKVISGGHTPYYYVNKGTRTAYIRKGDQDYEVNSTELNKLILRGRNQGWDGLDKLSAKDDIEFYGSILEQIDNAMEFHRSYLMRGTNVELSFYDDRIEIVSCGTIVDLSMNFLHKKYIIKDVNIIHNFCSFDEVILLVRFYVEKLFVKI